MLKKALLLLSAGALSDIVTTEYALSLRSKTSGFVELNPLAQTLQRRLLLKSAYVAGGALLINEVAKREGEEKAEALLTVAVALQVGFAAWNIYQIAQFKR